MALLLSVQSGDRITVADILFTVLSSPPRLVSTEATIPVSETNRLLPHGVTVSVADATSTSHMRLRFTTPAGVLITRIRGEGV